MKIPPTLEAASQYNLKLYNSALYLTKDNADEASELVQTLYIKLYDRLADENKKPLEYLTYGYLYRMLKHIFYNNKKRVKKEIEWDKKYDKTVQDNVWDDMVLEMRHNLNKIPFMEREVLLQQMEKGQRTLSKETGVCRERLRKYKNKALEILKDIYKNEYGLNNI